MKMYDERNFEKSEENPAFNIPTNSKKKKQKQTIARSFLKINKIQTMLSKLRE